MPCFSFTADAADTPEDRAASLRRMVARRIGDPGGAEPVAANLTRIAATTRGAVGSGIVAAVREAVIDAERDTAADDVCFREMDQRRVNAEAALAFDTDFRRQIRQALEGGDELRTAIGIATVIHRINAHKYVEAFNHFRPCQRQ